MTVFKDYSLKLL